MKLKDYLDEAKLADHISNKIVKVEHHRYAPLAIYNYTNKCTFDDAFDEVSCKTRGLIVNVSTGNVVARPWEKFWNLGQPPAPAFEGLPATLPEITEKLDGSLGILYKHGGFTGIATRGSFESDQAAWASAWYEKNLKQAEWPGGYTPLFEIIYPDNRIVVKYAWEGLALLGMVHIETGEELNRYSCAVWAKAAGCFIVSAFDKTVAELRTENEPNQEGYVCTWHLGACPPLKVKIKFVDYCRLHRLLTSISPKAIWEMLKDGQPFGELLDGTPEHYKDWVNYWKNGLQAEYGRLEQKAKAIYASCPLPKDSARKEFAQFFTTGDRKSVSAILFKMLDGQPYDEIVWKMVRERTRDQEPFRRETE